MHDHRRRIGGFDEPPRARASGGPHARMDDRFETPSCPFVRKGTSRQRSAIDRVARRDVRTEGRAELAEDLRVLESPRRELVGVDHVRAEPLERAGDRRLPGTDVPSQPDLERHGAITPRAHAPAEPTPTIAARSSASRRAPALPGASRPFPAIPKLPGPGTCTVGPRCASLTVVSRFAPFAFFRRGLFRTGRHPSEALADWPSLDRFGARPADGVVVGGAVRDALLGRPFRDVDWLVPEPVGAAHDLAARMGGSAFALDEARGHWRVVHEHGTLDLIRRDGSIEGDLARRDFTVNAIAVGPNGPIDPLDGRTDLARRRLVRAGPTSLEDDVLRGLRGVRFAATLELSWDPLTRSDAERVVREALAGDRSLPAAERMRDELVSILLAPRPGDALADAHALGWLEALFPELLAGDGMAQGGLHHLDVLQHQLEALQRLASGFPDAGVPLRLATLLHDVAKPACRTRAPTGRIRFDGHAERGADMTARALRRLRFDQATVATATELVRRHMLPLPRDEREARRFAHRRRALLPGLLQLMVADREAGRGRLSSEAGRRAYRTALARVLAIMDERPEPKPLLDGRDVMALLELSPGPRVGQAIAMLAEAQAVGDVTDRAQAVEALHRYAAAQGWSGPAERAPSGDAGEESP